MTSFVEQATLRLIDDTSGKARKINKELRSLFDTAKKMRNLEIRFKGAPEASRQLRTLTKDIERARTLARGRAPAISIPTISKAKLNNLTLLTNTLREYARVARSIPQISFPRAPRLPAERDSSRRHLGPVPGDVQVRLNISPLQALLAGFITRLGATIETSIINGFREGLKTRDVADTRLDLQLRPDQRRSARQAITETFQNQGGSGPSLSRAQVAQIFTEALPVTRGNTEATQTLTQELIKMIRLQIAQGTDTQQAIEGAFQFAKAGEQSGRFSDPVTGQFDADRARQFFDTLQKVAPDIGQEFTARFVAQATKYLRTSKFSLTPEGFATALFLNEESGSTASVGINQAIKQLSGERIQKKQMQRLIELGLLSEGEIRTGTVGGQDVTEVIGKGAVDEDKLRENILSWVRDRVIPAMQKAGFDPNNPVSTAKFAGQITSDRTATEALTTLILRNQELEQQINRAFERDTSDAALNQALSNSSLLALSDARNQLIGVLGEVANSFESILIPALRGVASVAATIQDFIAGPSGEGSAVRTGVVGAGVVAGGVLAARGAKSVFDWFNPLTKSAAALDGSAAALMRAAAALQMSATGQRLRSGRVPNTTTTAPLSTSGGATAVALGSRALGAFSIGVIVDDIIRGISPAYDNLRARLDDLVNKGQQKNTDFLRNLFFGKKDDGVPEIQMNPGSAANEATELKQQIAALTQQIADARANEKFPGTADLQVTQLESQRDFLSQQLAAMDQSKIALADTFTTGSTQLSESATQIDQAFTSGSSQISASAQQIIAASGVLAPALSAALSAGGEQVATSIRNALSTPVAVNVSTPAPRPDTGAAIPN